MGRPNRNKRAAVDESMTPPDQLTASQSVAKVVKVEGNSIYTCHLPSQRTVLVELAGRFHKTVWIKRGGYVLVDLTPPEEQKGKVEGEIINVVRDEKEWRKQTYWPKEFPRSTLDDEEDEEDEDSTVGRMPPSDSEDED